MREKECVEKHLLKTKLCALHLAGNCHYGGRCFYAHSEAELQAKPDLKKTSLCRNAGNCSLGSSCSFAHSSKELRESSRRIPCKWYLQGSCSHGKSCRFSHSTSSSYSSSTPSSPTTTCSESLLDLLKLLAEPGDDLWSVLLSDRSCDLIA